MQIFDRFPDRQAAERFAAAVRKTYGLTADVYDDQDRSDEVDPFPFELTPPIVLAERTYDKQENALDQLAAQFGGEGAGT
jgi:hypothetical protein